VNGQDGWHRLHPLSPAVRAGRVLVAFLVVFLPTFLGGSRSGWDAAVHGVILVVLLGLGVVSWLVTRWRIEGNNLHIETGLVRRSSLRYPLSQVQAIDTVRPGLARLFGLSELRLRMGGTGGSARLAYLPVKQADTLRARLLALSLGHHEDAPEPEDKVFVTVPPGRVVASILLTPQAVIVVLFIAVAVVAFATHSAARNAIAGSTVPFLFANVVALWRRFNRGYNATVAEAPEGLRVRSGLVETSAETIPRGRVQAVLLLQPLLWRPFGWCRLEVDVAGRIGDRGSERRSEARLRSVLPVGSRAQAQQLLALLVPGAPEPERRPPTRARWKSPLRYGQLSFGYDATYAVATSGRLARIQAWAPLTKVQSLRRVQGPVQRRFGVATVRIDTAGKRFGVAFRDLDADDSLLDLERMTELARAARRRA
jgi:putative membrane protein